MREYFREFSLSGLSLGTGPVAVWIGWVQPIQSSERLEALLDDIHHGRPVVMQARGPHPRGEAGFRPASARGAAYHLRPVLGDGRSHARLSREL